MTKRKRPVSTFGMYPDKSPLPDAHVKREKALLPMVLHNVPTKTMPDWLAVRDYVQAHGCMRLKDVNHNAAHAALHRHGIGLYQLKDDMGEPVGWIARPLKGEKA